MVERPLIVDIGYVIGGDEGQVLVEMLLDMFTAWAKRQGFVSDLLEKATAFGGGLKAAKLAIYAADAVRLASLHEGAHTMIRIPPGQSHRQMGTAGVRVSDLADLPLPEQMADWGDERRRYFFDPYLAIVDTRLGRLEMDPDIVFAGDFSALESA